MRLAVIKARVTSLEWLWQIWGVEASTLLSHQRVAGVLYSGCRFGTEFLWICWGKKAQNRGWRSRRHQLIVPTCLLFWNNVSERTATWTTIPDLRSPTYFSHWIGYCDKNFACFRFKFFRSTIKYFVAPIVGHGWNGLTWLKIVTVTTWSWWWAHHRHICGSEQHVEYYPKKD